MEAISEKNTGVTKPKLESHIMQAGRDGRDDTNPMFSS